VRARAALLAALLAAALWLPAAARAGGFGIADFETSFSEADGSPDTRAGSHPFAMDTFFEVNRHLAEKDGEAVPFVDGGDIRDLIVEQARGLIGDATAVPPCSTLDFATIVINEPSCPDNTAVGVTAVMIADPSTPIPAAVYNLAPPPGVPVRLGFVVSETPVTIDIGLKPEPDYNVSGGPLNAPQPLTVFGAGLQLWGYPADPRHDFARGHCAFSAFPAEKSEYFREGRIQLEDHGCERPAEGAPERPLLTLPRTCAPLRTAYRMTSWAQPPETDSGQVPTGPFGGCEGLEFDPSISSRATASDAAAGSGLDFELSFEDPADHTDGLTEPQGIAASDMKRIEVALPAGMTADPSLAEGLEVCTPADLARETLASEPGSGCPNGAKIGAVSVKTPLLGEEVKGNVFIAEPDDPATTTPGAENPFDSLLAFYIVLKNARNGVLVKVPAEVAPDPRSGQLVTTVDDTPQIPFSRFSFHFREGVRPPLIAPPACGAYATTARITPWARPGETITREATFRIDRGVGGGPCPSGGLAFAPGFEAGTANNAAGRYSPFGMRITRGDGEADLSRLSAVLPPGVLGKLAGVPYCPEAAIALAKAKTGLAERSRPSCPAASEIGTTLAGAGAGSALTYVPGSLYLAGPVAGDPLSVVAITPAVAGPFDAGTVVVREALRLNPVTGEVEVDGAHSDPIPHILRGIPLNLRDLRVSVDRPEFTLNATGCEEEQTRATLWSAGSIFSPAGEAPTALLARYQAADCAALGFKPGLGLKLRGGTRRGRFPALKAVVTPRPGDANFSRAVVTLPHSAFLEQGHFGTICTRVQFAAGAGEGSACPAGSVYGHVRAWSPLLAEPLEGPVFLRSSSHNLPDAVFALHGLVDIDLASRIDSKHGGIRSTFEAIPDAPVSRFILEMRGGRKGLIVNSTDLCSGTHRAKARLAGQNGKLDKAEPLVTAQCKVHKKKHKGRKKRGSAKKH
jgi:hypothetical protein